ncbi:MAG: hypothetical protein C5B51_09790 [Terriglobia bacterium]|nr:MAG: hypothetical protein C5B51_09790 [Terriglobia bacterium]
MKIQNDALQGSTPLETGRTQSTTLPAGAHALAGHKAAGHDGDSVEISGLSAHLSEANGVDARQREARVAELAALYAKGEYRVNPAQLGRKLVDHAIGAGKGVE